MDQTADPCTDFYQFACGRYVRNTPIHPDGFSGTIIDIVRDVNFRLRGAQMNTKSVVLSESVFLIIGEKIIINMELHIARCSVHSEQSVALTKMGQYINNELRFCREFLSSQEHFFNVFKINNQWP